MARYFKGADLFAALVPQLINNPNTQTPPGARQSVHIVQKGVLNHHGCNGRHLFVRYRHIFQHRLLATTGTVG